MGSPCVVDCVNHCRQRGGFAAAGFTGHQYDAAFPVRQSRHSGGQSQRFQFGNFVRQQAQGHGNTILLQEQIHANPPSGNGSGAVQLAGGHQIREPIACQLMGQCLAVFFCQNRVLHIRLQLTYNAVIRPQTANQMHVRGV